MRYLRLYLHFLRFSFSRAMEFRFDFFFRIGMDVLWYGVNFLFFWLLFRHTGLFGGWTYDQILVFMGGVFVADAVQMTVLSNNMWMFPILINKGDLDFYLVRPVSTIFFVSLRDFAANSFVNLLMAISILAWMLVRYPAPLGAGPVAIFAGLLAVGILLHYALQMLFLIPTFWMHASGGLREIFWSIDQVTSRPGGIFTGWVRRLLISILPFALIVTYPTRALFEPPGPLALHLIGATAGAFVVMLGLWRRGLRAYASASS